MKTDLLFKKAKIGNLTVKNRLMMGPMGCSGEADGSMKLQTIDYMEARAKGGWGIVTTGGCSISDKYEGPAGLGLFNDFHVERLSMMIDRCHPYGCKVGVELIAGMGATYCFGEGVPYAASAIPFDFVPGENCKELSKDDIHFLTNAMGHSAELAQRAGADFIEIECETGYLNDQFQTPLWNKRTDEYGGSLENRMRFTLECIQSIQEQCGEDFPIVIKFCPEHYIEGGIHIEEGLQIAKMLEAAGVAALHVDVGCHENYFRASGTVYAPPGHQLNISSQVKKAVNIPVFGHGKLQYPELAQKVLEEEMLDIVVMAHQSLADPEWPNKVREGLLYEINQCIGCNECLRSPVLGKHYQCTVNPVLYEEKLLALPKESKKKYSVLVIGGGPGGMQAAIAAADRGFDVELWEASDKLGGNLLAAGAPAFKSDVLRYIHNKEIQLHRRGVLVRFMKEATAEKVIAGNYDKIILASGANPIFPGIPGIENCKESISVLMGLVKTGKTVAVIGGGLVGCEVALHLKQTGAEEVTVIEKLDEILLGEGHSHENSEHLKYLLNEEGVKIITEADVTCIEKNYITFIKNDKENKLNIDSAVIAVGFRPDHSLENALDGKVNSLSVIGDAVQQGMAIKATHAGYNAIRIME